MTTAEQLAKHLREVYFGGNWTWSDLTSQLKGMDLERTGVLARKTLLQPISPG